MAEWTQPTVANFKARFVRDFPYAPATDALNAEFVMDSDIQIALNSAAINFNTGLGADGAGLTEMFLLLSAFYLVQNLKVSAKGISSQADFIANSKGVGSVNVGYAIPEDYLKHPLLSQFASNGYGMQFLLLVYPYLVGQVEVVEGTTTFA